MIILEDELIKVGTLGTTKGLKGKMRLNTNDDLMPLVGNKIIVNYRSYTLFEVEDIVNNEIKLKGIDSIEDAKNLINSSIYIAKKDLDNFDYVLFSELFGSKVIFKDRVIGTIDNVIDTKVYNILVVNGDREYNIPMVSEFVEDYDREKRIIELKVLEDQF